MSSLTTKLAILGKIIFLCIAVAWIGHGPAEAQNCGGKDQKACGVWESGPQCNSGLKKYKGKCRAWGKRNEKAWPASRVGFRCDKNLGVKDGKCVPCGHGDGQPACEAARSGPQCYRYMENVNGICRARGGNGQDPYSGAGFDCKPGYNVGEGGKCRPCGGEDQIECEALRKGPQCEDGLENYKNYCRSYGNEGKEAWPAIRVGFRCNTADLAPNAAGVCSPCGGSDQIACETMRPGNRCTANYHQENDAGICEARGGDGQPAFTGLGFECQPGYNWDRGFPGNRTCEPCGGLGEIVCEVMREGPVCEEGLTRDIKWGRDICVPTLEDDVEQAALRFLEDAGTGLFNTIVPMAFELNDDEDRLEGLAGEDDGAAGAAESDADAAAGGLDLPEIKTLSFGAAAEANFIVGFGVETGVAIDIHNDPRNRMRWYGSGSASAQLGAGSSYGAVIGMWANENDDIDGPSVGLVFDIRNLLDTIGLSSNFLTDIGTQSSTATVLVGVWYERDGDELGDFAGITISPVLGVGGNALGTTYVEATTIQPFAPGGLPITVSSVTIEEGDDESVRNYCTNACRLNIN
ncbi:MAG: hypothetical protein AAFX02_04515 [Pseudomonadota bacterium]